MQIVEMCIVMARKLGIWCVYLVFSALSEFIFSWLCSYLFENRNTKEWYEWQEVRVMRTTMFYLFVGWILVMIWYIMDGNKQSVLFRSLLVVISDAHLFIIAYKLHWVCVIERGFLPSIYFRHLYIYMSIFKETIIKNQTIFFR